MIDEHVIMSVISEMKNGFSEKENISETRDVFTARIQSYVIRTKKYLESAIIGEIGNNTFDHNFLFEDNLQSGVYCNLSYNNQYVILRDYGRGIKGSLLPVLPSISTDLEALEIAFTKQISGRSPEQRGNGLKFVSETIKKNYWHLYFQSGFGSCSIDKDGIAFKEESISIIGCLAILNFNEGN